MTGRCLKRLLLPERDVIVDTTLRRQTLFPTELRAYRTGLPTVPIYDSYDS